MHPAAYLFLGAPKCPGSVVLPDDFMSTSEAKPLPQATPPASSSGTTEEPKLWPWLLGGALVIGTVLVASGAVPLLANPSARSSKKRDEADAREMFRALESVARDYDRGRISYEDFDKFSRQLWQTAEDAGVGPRVRELWRAKHPSGNPRASINWGGEHLYRNPGRPAATAVTVRGERGHLIYDDTTDAERPWAIWILDDFDGVEYVGRGATPEKAVTDAEATMARWVRSNPGRAKKLGLKAEDFNQQQLAIGTKHELEHTDNAQLAQQIAMDHLAEDENYYTKLAAMERKRG